MPMWELIYNNAIIKEGDFRSRIFDRADLKFCSLLGTNLAYVKVQSQGYFLGNGWENCNLFAMELKDARLEMDRFQRCSMGSMDFQRVRLEDVRFGNCSLSGSVWSETVLEGGVFQDCCLRGMRFQKVSFQRTVFRRCILDGCCLEEAEMERVRFCGCTLRGVEGLPEKGAGFRACSF